MSRLCTICTHPEREEIDKALVNSGTFRDIAERFGLAKSSVDRHASEHLPASLLAARDQEEIERANELLKTANKTAADILEQAETLQKVAETILDRAYGAGTYKTALQAVREARECLRLQGELLGELDRRPQIGIVIASPEWAAVRTLILNALADYPEARQAVARALGDGQTS